MPNRADSETVGTSAFLLSITSPVWKFKLCGPFGTHPKRLELKDGDDIPFKRLMDLVCGLDVPSLSLEEAMQIGSMAAMFDVKDVCAAVEDAVLRRLGVSTCGDLLVQGMANGLHWLERESRALAVERFEEFVATDGFLRLSEEALASMLQGDLLRVEGAVRVREAVAWWMEGPRDAAAESPVQRGESLQAHLRSLQDNNLLSLDERERSNLSAASRLVGEALTMLAGRAAGGHPPPTRRLTAAPPPLWSSGRGRRAAARGEAYCVATVGRVVCCGLGDGVVQVWDRATLAEERLLAGHSMMVCALAAWERWVISGSGDGKVSDDVWWRWCVWRVRLYVSCSRAVKVPRDSAEPGVRRGRCGRGTLCRGPAWRSLASTGGA